MAPYPYILLYTISIGKDWFDRKSYDNNIGKFFEQLIQVILIFYYQDMRNLHLKKPGV